MNRIEEWLEQCPRFRYEILGRRFHFFEATAARAASARELTPSWSAESLVEAGGEIHGWFEWLNGRHRAALVSPSAAIELFRSGITLYVRSPRFLEALGDEFAEALRVPRKFVECSVFVNQPGAVTRMHFDYADSLTVQIRGSKRWTLAPNMHTPEPLISWGTLDPVTPAMQMYTREPLPTSTPSDAQTFLLEPGGMLYVPRGCWHQTLSEEESASLHIHLVPYSWIDAVLATLRAQLSRDEAWRRSAFPLWDPEYADSLSAAAALDALRDAVGDIRVGDLARVSTNIAARDRIKSRARSAFGIESEDNACAQATFTVEEHGVEHEIKLEMSPEYVAATRLIASHREGLSSVDLAGRIPGLSSDEALQLARMLCDIGYARGV